MPSGSGYRGLFQTPEQHQATADAQKAAALKKYGVPFVPSGAGIIDVMGAAGGGESTSVTPPSGLDWQPGSFKDIYGNPTANTGFWMAGGTPGVTDPTEQANINQSEWNQYLQRALGSAATTGGTATVEGKTFAPVTSTTATPATAAANSLVPIPTATANQAPGAANWPGTVTTPATTPTTTPAPTAGSVTPTATPGTTTPTTTSALALPTASGLQSMVANLTSQAGGGTPGTATPGAQPAAGQLGAAPTGSSALWTGTPYANPQSQSPFDLLPIPSKTSGVTPWQQLAMGTSF